MAEAGAGGEPGEAAEPAALAGDPGADERPDDAHLAEDLAAAAAAAAPPAASQVLLARPVHHAVERYRRLVLVVDAVSALAGAMLAQFLREVLFGASLTVDGQHVPYLLVAVVAVASWLAILAVAGAYQHAILGSGTEEYRRIIRAAVGALAVAVLIVFLTRAQVARGFVMGLAPLIAGWTLFGRYLARNWLARQRAQGLQMRRVVVLGRPEAVLEAVRHFRGAVDQGYQVVSACVVGDAPADVVDELGMPVLPAGDPISAVRDERAEILAIAGTEALPTGALRTLAWDLEGTGVDLIVVPTITDVAGPRVSVQPVAGLPLLLVEPPRLTGGARLVKSLVDRVTAFVLVLLLLPVFVVIGLLVRLTSRGPAIFRQTRIGRDGKPFTMWKFRTMTERAEQDLDTLVTLNEHDGLLFKIRDDPRRTTVGKWLRRFSLDELPQLVHVLSGKMSLVGPRPPLPSEVAKYPEDVRRRLLVKPGLTGLWQVSGRADLPWSESVRLDLYYVDNWSLSMDLVIVLKTATAVLHGKGAY